MPIAFLPNDPLAARESPLRKKTPRANRAASRAGFDLADTVPAAVYAVGTPEFVHWQCRDAVLLTLKTWEGLDGKVASWARSSNPRKLDLLPDDGDDLNAYYDGQSLAFFHHEAGGRTTWSGASTDVVAHETGHGLLDHIRPELWDSNFTEAGAFHEAFADCVALIVSLSDKTIRRKLLRLSPDLGSPNFVEATAEDLSDGVRLDPTLGPSHPAAKPRHALNNFQWRLPSMLPRQGGPDVLTSEVHSFARVFSGCFFDTIRNVFATLGPPSEAKLWTATKTAARLLIRGVKGAMETPRYFQAVGRAMDLVDQAAGGANHAAVRDAFARHGIALGSAAMLAPRAALAGAAPKMAARAGAVSLSATTRNDLRERLQAERGAPLELKSMRVGGRSFVQATHFRAVPLGGLSPRLKGVTARVAENVLLESVADARGGGRRAALVSSLPEPNASADEVYAFVDGLLASDRIDTGKRAAVRRRGRATHGVQKQALVRLRFD